jgi:hypothetical protein
VREKSPMHEHPRAVVVFLTDAKGISTGPDGKATPLERKAGDVAWREATVHTIENTGTTPLDGFVVEMKKPAPKAKPAAAKK